ncbi:MAG: class I SAM-dependent methyltransferase [Alphaproteobacteria bacterium]|nr:class I SAM-dependent methyltransferase [Alphaproteobacteria bacterium]
MIRHKLDTYLDLCTQVYDLSKPRPPEDAYAFYRSYLMEAKGVVLEPMCGTGRFFLPLLEEGFDVYGFDASDHMLHALHTKARFKNLKPNVWQGLVENLEKLERYSLIFIPSGSFGLIIDLNSARTAIRTFYDHLKDDGILVFEAETLNSASEQVGIWRASVWLKEDGKTIIANFLDLPLADNVSPALCKYELIDDHQIVSTEIENFKVRLYNPEDMIRMIKSVGFREVRMIKAFDRSAAPSENDKSVIYECLK